MLTGQMFHIPVALAMNYLAHGCPVVLINSAAATSIPGAVLGGAMDGVLRAYAADTGEVLWSFDTAREFAATDGGVARGGSMGGASGAVPSGDMLFVNSGYGIYFHMPGAALLAFGPKN